MQNKPCQSYVLDEIHRELLLGEKKGAISDVEKTFPVKGRLYEIKLTAEIPLVFQVNTLTSISCVEHVHLEANQLDSLITIHVQEPTSAHSTLDITNNLPILQFKTWDMNDHIGFFVPEIESNRYSWDILIKKCLKIILKTGSLSHTIGIDVPIEISKYHPEFFPKVLAAVQNLPQNHKRPIYILLLVKTEEIKNTVAEILKKIADSKSDVHSASLLAKAEGTSSKSKGAIPKRKPEPLRASVKEVNLKYIYASLQWIQFFDYTFKEETLDQAITDIDEQLNNVKFSMKSDEAKNLFYFYDLMPLVPNIAEQLDTMQTSLLVPNRSGEQFKKILTEYRTQHHTDTFPINSGINKSHLKHYLIKICQQFPKIKCEIVNSSENENLLFSAPNFDHIQAAKYQLESFFGLRKHTSLSPNRFQENNQGLSASAYMPMSASTYNEPKVTGVLMTEPTNKPQVKNILKVERFEEKHDGPLTVNSKNNQDVKCFQIERNFLIKVYQGNILQTDVDGIVNAANKWLQHGGGIARVICKAAGDIIHTEGQSKLNGRTLNDGDVVSTSAGNLKQYKYIIHAVGPMKSSLNSDEYCRKKISETILNTLKEASQLGLCSIAVPAISSNIFGVPLSICTDGYFSGVMEFCKSRTPSCQLNEVHFVDMNPATSSAIKDCFEKQLKNAPAEIAKNNVPQPKDNSSNISNNEIPRNRTLKEKERCPVCYEPNSNKLKCGHICCKSCIKKLKPPCCPMCRKNFDTVYGDQPDGTMTIDVLPQSLPGFSQNQTYEIHYNMHCETDQTTRIAYMPKCKRGDHILKMLQLAFERRLIFTIGESRTTGYQNAITWNEIHHKTRKYTTPDNCYSYPDPEYFTKVSCELADKGITPDLAQNRKIKRYIKMKGGNVVHSSDF